MINNNRPGMMKLFYNKELGLYISILHSVFFNILEAGFSLDDQLLLALHLT